MRKLLVVLALIMVGVATSIPLVNAQSVCDREDVSDRIYEIWFETCVFEDHDLEFAYLWEGSSESPESGVQVIHHRPQQFYTQGLVPLPVEGWVREQVDVLIQPVIQGTTDLDKAGYLRDRNFTTTFRPGNLHPRSWQGWCYTQHGEMTYYNSLTTGSGYTWTWNFNATNFPTSDGDNWAVCEFVGLLDPDSEISDRRTDVPSNQFARSHLTFESTLG